MATAKWLGGFLGFMTGGPLGALAGFALGWLFEQGLDSVNNKGEYNNREYDDNDGDFRQRAYEGQRNSFIFSLLALSAYIINADGKIMHSEMETVRRFLKQNFGDTAAEQGEEIIRRIFEQQKQMGPQQFHQTIMSACAQIAANMDYSQRLQLLNFLAMIAQADGIVADEEVIALKNVAAGLGLSNVDVDSMLNLSKGATSIDAAYKVLGITPQASNDEVKTAYRQMALKHHPDRVTALGEDVRKAAEKKFQEINEAKDIIYKSRGI